ncbi:hypothetical protein [Streptomyces griseosporeus]|uniref:hypothetical protein n=1 Tax=Streptomyces griseosporeus TaxID=1910 RepID=UPI0036F7EB48
MSDTSTAERAAGFLLGLTDEETAARVRARTGLPGPEDRAETRLRLARTLTWGHGGLPASVILWALEEDDPGLNAVLWQYAVTDPGLRRAMARGVPFGPGRTEPLPVDRAMAADEPEIPGSCLRLGLVGALRAADSLGKARSAASMVLTEEDWWTVTVADDEQPLPGYARWALSVRPDCPRELREQFGSHPKFTHRLRQAGVLDGPAEYATAHGPAVRVLDVLSLGHVMFPARMRAAEDALRPLVHEHLGDREEAWAILAQLMGTFHGTAPELIATAGAIA